MRGHGLSNSRLDPFPQVDRNCLGESPPGSQWCILRSWSCSGILAANSALPGHRLLESWKLRINKFYPYIWLYRFYRLYRYPNIEGQLLEFGWSTAWAQGNRKFTFSLSESGRLFHLQFYPVCPATLKNWLSQL